MGNRYRICVIGAEVNNIEQRHMLSGIIEEAQKKNAVILVLSNLYNHLDPLRNDSADNRIYELISHIKVDAFIMLSESFVNTAVREGIHDLLKKRTDVPVVIAGTALPGFEPELFTAFNTSDQSDMEAIVDKLLEENNFTSISLLAGPFSLEPSQRRINGYRSSLDRHGIHYNESFVYEGDFWYSSGEKLAGRYISGELPYPQALVCANDYMAFGVLDAFAAAGVDITEHMALVGYEYIPERSLHRPLLTTYQRNRKSLGAKVIDFLVRKLSGEDAVFFPPQGIFISGQTCHCDGSEDRLQAELTFLRTRDQYAYWGLKSDMESRLTECRNYDEFVSAMGEELFIVRNARDIVLCLFENWFKENEEHSDTLICRNTNKYSRREDIVLKVSEIDKLAEYFPGMAVIYFNPIFFRERLLGYCAVMYDRPDTYDDTYRHWMKSVSNGLEFLRLKTDIDFLLQCSTFSASYDGLTGLFSAEGMRTAFQLMKNTDRPVGITAVAFRIVFNKDVFASENISKEMISSLVATAKTLSRFCGGGGIAGRISESELLLVCPADTVGAEILADAVHSEIVFSKAYSAGNSGSKLLYCGKSYCGEKVTFSSITDDMTDFFDSAQKSIEDKKSSPYYKELEELHREVMHYPLQKYSLDEVGSSLGLSPNYFNRLYKQLYGISFCQDQISSRLRLAKHLLLSTDDNVSVVAEKCEYTDSKYFLRQFTASAGLTPRQYRTAIKVCLE